MPSSWSALELLALTISGVAANGDLVAHHRIPIPAVQSAVRSLLNEFAPFTAYRGPTGIAIAATRSRRDRVCSAYSSFILDGRYQAPGSVQPR